MPITIWAARSIGAEFRCELVEYMRTIVYKVPGLKVTGPKPAAYVMLDDPEFKASVVVDPPAYLKDEGVSDQFHFEDNFEDALSQACPSPMVDSEAALYLVIQFKEDLNSFSAMDGQCRKICVDGAERYVLVECGEPYTPSPNERKRTINAVLTAVRGEFGVTEGMEPCFNTRCYRATSGQCVHPFRVEISEPTVEVIRPIDGTEVTGKAAAAAALALQIESSRQEPDNVSGPGRVSDFSACLEELIEALQLDDTTDHAYWRLWYLQLSDRIEKFGEQCRPRLQLGNEEGLKDEYDHRNMIAHRGVDRIDGSLLRSIQTKAIGIIKRKI